MEIIQKNQVVYGVFRKFQQFGVKHCFSTRLGGVSKPPYDTMNLSFGRDDHNLVTENFRIMAEVLQISLDYAVLPNLAHGNKVFHVMPSHVGLGFRKNVNPEGYDSLVTNVPEVCLVTFHADCVPVYFYDPVCRAIGLAHSGWRGTAARIVKEVVKSMGNLFGSEPENLMAGIGPYVGPCCYEVDWPVADAFSHMPFAGHYMEGVDGAYRLDLGSIIYEDLLSLDLKAENIEKTSLCTLCNEKLFFSHRRSGFERGSMAAFIALPESKE